MQGRQFKHCKSTRQLFCTGSFHRKYSSFLQKLEDGHIYFLSYTEPLKISYDSSFDIFTHFLKGDCSKFLFDIWLTNFLLFVGIEACSCATDFLNSFPVVKELAELVVQKSDILTRASHTAISQTNFDWIFAMKIWAFYFGA